MGRSSALLGNDYRARIPEVRPPWRAPVIPRFNPAGPRFADAQGNILTHGGSILIDSGGTIIDDASPDPPCCCDCVGCRVPATAGEFCQCLPTRYLVVVTGTVSCSTCYCIDSSGGPLALCQKGKAPGNVDGAYCIAPGMPSSVTGTSIWETWGNDGPTCAPPATRLDNPTFNTVQWALTATFTGNVSLRFTIKVVTIGVSTDPIFFDGSIISTDCEGPWVLSNSSPGCLYDGFNTWAAVGGTATVYACGC